MKQVSVDDFLNGKVRLKQSINGLRATSDAVLVASAVKPKEGDSVLDVGAGNGVIGICIASRTNIHLTALEIQENLVQLIQENAKLNDHKITVIQTDLFHGNDPLKGKQFHHVVTNPPFYDTTGASRQNKEQEIAFSAHSNLDDWLIYCLKHVRAKGTFTIIHRPEMLASILTTLEQKLGAIEIVPIYSKKGQNAKRIIVRGILGSKKPTVIHPPLALYTITNKPTSSANKLLRDGEELD